jgi:hypothetical protein
LDQCLSREDGEVPRIEAPIWIGERPRPPATRSRPQNEFEGLIGRERKLPDRFSAVREEFLGGGKGRGMTRGRSDKRLYDEEDLRCPLVGALDPMSDMPMLNPMVDRDGYVMDLRSWRKVFRSGAEAPFPTEAEDEYDLEELTALNFAKLRPFIVNMAC